MGDRALIIFKTEPDKSSTFGQKDNTKYGPVIYLHWDGQAVPDLLKELKTLMADRTDDIQYATARMIGIVHTHSPGNMSLGVWSLPEDFKEDAYYLKDMSHGDAGVVIVDCKDFSWKAYGGYLSEH